MVFYADQGTSMIRFFLTLEFIGKPDAIYCY